MKPGQKISKNKNRITQKITALIALVLIFLVSIGESFHFHELKPDCPDTHLHKGCDDEIKSLECPLCDLYHFSGYHYLNTPAIEFSAFIEKYIPEFELNTSYCNSEIILSGPRAPPLNIN